MKATKQATPGTSGRSAPARGKFGKICLVLLLLVTAVFCGFAPRAWAEPAGCWTDVDAEGKPLYADISWYTDNPNDCNEYDLWDAADLAGLAYLVNNCKDYFVDFETGSLKIVRLRAAVDMSAHYWEPIGTFMTAVDDEGTIQDTTPGFVGIFDGGRYAISGIYVKRDEYPVKNVYAGFFGSTAFNSNMPGVEGSPVISPMLISINIVDATIEGGLEEFSSKGSNNIEITREPLAAGIVALAHGTAGTRIHDCTFSGSVNGYDAAGIVGQNNGGYVYTSVNMGAVSAVRYAGGIVARDFYRGDKGVTQCTNEGMITSDFAAGGITGIHGASTAPAWYPSQINNCASTGPVVGAKYSGAIAGYTVRSTGGDYSTCWYWLSEGSKATSSLGGHKSESFTAPKEAGEEDTLAGMPPTTVILDCADAPFGRMEGQKTDYSIDPARYVHPNNDGIYTLGPIAVYPTGSAAAENIVVSEYAVFKPDFTLSRTHLTREEYSEAYKACLTDYTGEDGYVRLRIYSEDDGRMEDTRAGAGTLLRYTEYNTDPRLLVEKIIDVPLITLSGATLKAGETAVLTASFDPDTTPQSARGLKWSSDNESVATVDASGKVTAVGVGQARITAVSEVFEETPEAECVVTVNKNDVQIESVALDKTAIEITTGNTAQLSASVLPEGSPQGVTWSSSNAEVALVDEAGLVTAIAEGTAVVTATSSADSSKSASCTVTVAGDTPPEPAKDPVVNVDGANAQSSAPVADTELPEGVTVIPLLSSDKENAALDALKSGGETGTPHIDGIDQTEPGAVNALTMFSLNVAHDDVADGDLTITLTLADAINVAEGSSLYAFIPYRAEPQKFGSFICTPATGEITSVTFTVTGYARFFSEAPVILAAVKGSAPQPAPSGGGGGGGGCSAGWGALALLAVVPLFARRKK